MDINELRSDNERLEDFFVSTFSDFNKSFCGNILHITDYNNHSIIYNLTTQDLVISEDVIEQFSRVIDPTIEGNIEFFIREMVKKHYLTSPFIGTIHLIL